MVRILSLLLCFFILSQPAPAQDKIAPASADDVEISFSPLVKKVAPAVVNIYAERIVRDRMAAAPFFDDPFFQRFFGRSSPFGGMSRERVERSLGSGVIVEPTGLIVTNAHVIQNAEDVTVALRDGREFSADVILEDEPSDIALIQIREDVQDLPDVVLKPSDSLEVGDLVLAIGNPFGVGQTVTSGIVSALARSSLNINDFNFFIQTDAAINPGNSGGPLVAMDGGVVGINTAIFSRSGGNLGIGFAVPSEIVASIISAQKSGMFDEFGIIRPWLGVTAQKLSGEIAESLGRDSTLGALISDLHEASPFRKAGLKAGDVVLEVNDHTIRSPEELKFRMTMIPIGEAAELVFYRNGKKQTARVTTIKPPDTPPRNLTKLDGNNPLSGAVIGNLNPAFIAELGLKDLNASGVAVIDVAPRSPADRIGFEKGTLIREINGQAIENVNDVTRALQKGPGSRGWEMVLNHRGQMHRLVLR